MKEIELTQGYKTMVDDDKYDYLMQWNWCVQINNHGKNPYVVRRKGSGYIFMHQELLPCEDGYYPDHIDNNGLNNQLSNLRKATREQNRANSRPSSSTGYKGVTKDHNSYRAGITINKIYINLGFYKTPEEAARAYDKKAKEVWGHFAWLNFPKGDTKND